MKNRIYAISLALIVLAFLSSCNGDPSETPLVGKSEKQTFEVSYDIEIDVKESLLSMKKQL